MSRRGAAGGNVDRAVFSHGAFMAFNFVISMVT